MGSLCSPDRIDPNAIEPNTTPRVRPTNIKNGFTEDSTATYSHSQNETTEDFSTSQSQTNNPKDHSNDGLNVDFLDDIETDEHSDQQISKHIPLSQPIMDNTHENTSRSGLKQMQNHLSLTQKKKKGLQIIVTPANDTSNTSNTTNNTSENSIDTQNIDTSDLPDTPDTIDYNTKTKFDYFDSTLGGQISWKKVADFSALLPREVKLKLWNSIFKIESDYNQRETKRISKVLKTFVMLHLTREYKRTNSTVPSELKQELSRAVKEPSKFIASFLKKDESLIDQTLLTIYDTISEKFKSENASKRAKYAKKAKMTQDNYAELTSEDLSLGFNKDDFLKTAFLQYMLYAFQIKLDTDIRKEYSE